LARPHKTCRIHPSIHPPSQLPTDQLDFLVIFAFPSVFLTTYQPADSIKEVRCDTKRRCPSGTSKYISTFAFWDSFRLAAAWCDAQYEGVCIRLLLCFARFPMEGQGWKERPPTAGANLHRYGFGRLSSSRAGPRQELRSGSKQIS
jgi:hypothetical protein